MQKFTLDYSDNPDLSAYAMSKTPGDECEITVKGKLISTDGGVMEMSVEEIEYEYEDETMETEPSDEEPVALAVLAVSDMEEESSEEGREMMGDYLYDEDDEVEES
jgi:hypothetical protein